MARVDQADCRAHLHQNLVKALQEIDLNDREINEILGGNDKT